MNPRPASFAARYERSAERLLPDSCPIEAGLMGRIADLECPHGHLPRDRKKTCACWAGEEGKR